MTIQSKTDSSLQVELPTKGRYWPVTFSGRLNLIFWVILFLALVPHTVSFLVHSFEVITWPYQIDYDEGLNLSTAWHLAQGHNIYGLNPPDHFIAAPYPPLYFALNALGIKIWGIQLQVGRILSFTASIAIAVMIGWGVRMALQKAKASNLNSMGAALVAGLLWFVPGPVFYWSTLYKQDLVAIAIAVLAIVLVYRWRDSRWLWLTAPLMALAFFAKQNELLATGVGCGYILLYNWRRGWKLTILTLISLVLPFIILNFITNNGYYNHTIAYQLVPWHLDDFIARMLHIIINHFVFIIIGLFYLISSLATLLHIIRVNQGRARLTAIHEQVKEWLFLIYLCAGIFSLFTVGAYQGNFNLTLDLFPPLMIVTGIWLGTQAERLGKTQNTKDRQASVFISIILLAIMLSQIISLSDISNYFPANFLPSPTRRALIENLQQQIAAAPPGDLLTDDIYLALSAGRNVPYDNLYHILIESSFSKWDDSRFLQDIRNYRFSLVIHDANPIRFSDIAWDTLNTNYEIVFQGDLVVWKPRK